MNSLNAFFKPGRSKNWREYVLLKKNFGRKIAQKNQRGILWFLFRLQKSKKNVHPRIRTHALLLYSHTHKDINLIEMCQFAGLQKPQLKSVSIAPIENLRPLASQIKALFNRPSRNFLRRKNYRERPIVSSEDFPL